MRLLVAPQEFKGTLTAREAAEVMVRALRSARPEAQVDVLPLADGGPGTLEAVARARPQAQWRSATVEDPLGRPVTARFLLMDGGHTAVLEMAEAAGLWRLAADERAPLVASTFGVGQLVAAALDAGARRLFVGLGGSATNDGGVGSAQALGVRFLAADGSVVAPAGPRARRQPVTALADVMRVDLSSREARLLQAELLLATDVTSPLLGPQGASRLFGPQKGAGPAEVDALEAALAHLARRVAEATGADVSSTPGVGAAGGLAFGLAALFGGRIRSGFELVADVSGLEARLEGADWVLTGEGRLDAQSLLGKGPVALAGRARAHGCRVAAFVGQCTTDAAGVFDAVVEAPAGTPLSPERAARALEEAVSAWASAVSR